jgi:4-diphosphocytidyl-2-C-methyl-D-erythritol kinase
MVVFPNCKINIGLRVTGKRADGFHNIESVFFPVALKDAIEIVEDPATSKKISYTSTGLKIPGKAEDDLCVKAYQLLKTDFPQLPNIKMHLHKAIPMGAGLGGGSADASFVLKLINQKFNLDLSSEKLIEYAAKLGSDCPFFIINEPCYVMGRGEILEKIPVDISAYKIILINPGIHINTGWAFSNITIQAPGDSLKELIKSPINSWQQHIKNDFEVPVFKAHPEIETIKLSLLEQSAVYASMSGSGSTVFGIFEKHSSPTLNFPAHYFWKWV